MRPIDASKLLERLSSILDASDTEHDKNAVSLLEQLVTSSPTVRLVPAPPPNGFLGRYALDLVRAERARQEKLWGDQSGNSLFEWMSILGEEYGELCEAVNETCCKNPHHPDRGGVEHIVKEASQVAAVALQIIEAACRRRLEEEVTP